jgi:hypothetical protein
MVFWKVKLAWMCYITMDTCSVVKREQIFLGVFAKLRQATISVIVSLSLSVPPHGTTRFRLDGFSWNLMFYYYRKSVEKNQVSFKSEKNNGYLTYRAIYRVIKKSLCTWWLQYTKLQIMFKVAQPDCLAAGRQGQGDTRLTLMPSVIPNANYVIMVSDWNCLT